MRKDPTIETLRGVEVGGGGRNIRRWNVFQERRESWKRLSENQAQLRSPEGPLPKEDGYSNGSHFRLASRLSGQFKFIATPIPWFEWLPVVVVALPQ